MGRWRRLVGTPGALLIACLAAFAAPASAQTPPYITAKPDAAARAFGADVAKRIFSNAGYGPIDLQKN